MTLLAVAFGAGVLATVNPCGFAMLPAFFGLSIGRGTGVAGSTSGRMARGFVAGVAVSAGFTAVFTITGLLITLGMRQLAQAVPTAAVIVGGVLVVAGLAMVVGRPLSLAKLNLSVRRRSPSAASTGHGLGRMVVFGAGYVVASLSCTLGVLLAVVAQVTATGQLAQTVAVFVAYAAGAATILVSVAVATALAHAGLTTRIRGAIPVVSRVAGALLALSGLYLVAYWWPAINGEPPSASVARITEGISAQLTRFLDHPVLLAVLAGGLVLVGAVVIAARRRRAPAETGRPESLTIPESDTCDCEPAPSVVQDVSRREETRR